MANVLNSKTGAPQPDPEEPAEADEEEAPLLSEPREGLPPVVVDEAHLARVTEAFGGAAGPVAVDAERASGYRYGQRAYLVQLRREGTGAGTALVDPVACPHLGGLAAVLADTEVVLHAAHQDLPCLGELGFRPAALFDTELAGRLLGYQRVGLGTMVEGVLGLRLAKEHSAVDWSVRPLPEDWLRYAALDVEVLIDLRDVLETQLAEAGKLQWAHEEFAAVLATPPKEPRTDPWRRTSGIHRVRTQRALGVVRELWLERDRIAQERDLAPGRVLPDSAIVAAATTLPRTAQQLTGIKPFSVKLARRYVPTWVKAIDRVLQMSTPELPQPSPQGDGPPPTNRWADRDPAAARRLESTRAAVSAIAEDIHMPAENLLQPDTVRRLAWSPPTAADSIDAATVAGHLRDHGAREWQVSLTTETLAKALRQANS